MNIQEIIIKNWGLEHMSSEEQESILDKVGTLVFQAVVTRGLSFLSEEDQDNLEKELEGKEDPHQYVLDFLSGHISGFEVLIRDEVESIKRQLGLIS
jgi:hypothetical protein